MAAEGSKTHPLTFHPERGRAKAVTLSTTSKTIGLKREFMKENGSSGEIKARQKIRLLSREQSFQPGAMAAEESETHSLPCHPEDVHNFAPPSRRICGSPITSSEAA